MRVMLTVEQGGMDEGEARDCRRYFRPSFGLQSMANLLLQNTGLSTLFRF